LYKKPTDNKQYLLYSIEHPRHVKKYIPFAQAILIKRIIEDPTTLAIELENLKQNFVSRHYLNNVIDTAITRVINPDRINLINYNKKSVSKFNATPFVLTFCNSLISNQSFNIHRVVKDSWFPFGTTV